LSCSFSIITSENQGGQRIGLKRSGEGGRALQKLEVLYQWQEARLKKKKLEKKIKNLPEKYELAQRKEQLEALEKELESKRNQVAELSRELKRKEDQAAKVETQRKNYEKKLYKGETQSAKELEQLQMKVTQIQKEEARLEEDILETMMHLDEGREEEEKKAGQYKEERKKNEGVKKEYDEEKEQLGKEVFQLEEEISQLDGSIEKKLKERCLSLAERTGLRGVVPVEGSSCGGCKVSLSAYVLEQVKGGKEIVTCESCSRMLFLPGP